jgi:hypothetical protein
MTRLHALTITTALLAALACAACGTAEQQREESGEPEKQAAAVEQSEPAKADEPAPASAPKALPEKWSALAEQLAVDDRPELAEGVAPTLAASGEGEVELPIPGGPTGSGETHTRHGWKMPDGHGSAVGVVRWTDESWKDIKVDLGIGICPHRGRRLVSDVASTGTAVAHHAATEPADDPNWFIHVNADANQVDKAGETLSYIWAVYTY